MRTDDYEPMFRYHGLKIRAAGNVHEQCAAILAALSVPRGARVLDLGAGEGAFSQRLVDQGYSVTAVELIPERFAVDTSHLSVDLNRDFSDQIADRFDVVVGIEIIEHLENPRHFVRECIRLLRPGGIVLLSSPNVESWASRIAFLKDGHPSWFRERDYDESGHINPLFTWQMEQICREIGASLTIHSSDTRLLRDTHGQSRLTRLRNKSYVLGRLLSPAMKGRLGGEINIYVIRAVTSTSS